MGRSRHGAASTYAAVWITKVTIGDSYRMRMSVRCRPPSTRQPGVKAAEGMGVSSTPAPGSSAEPASSSHVLTSFSWICIHGLYNMDSLDGTYLRTDSALPAESRIYHCYAILYSDSSMRANINAETTTGTYAALSRNHHLSSNVFPSRDLSLCPEPGRVPEVALSLPYCRLGKSEEVCSWQLQKAHPTDDHEHS
jgi:hypothetical protein